ncbi:MAG TPA: hypothetical protein VH020_00510 [Stellaceae bacterium]|nr:hypothetical protein [Stellaceae bacterium]
MAPTQHEVLLRAMALKPARAVLSLEGAFLATNPTPNSEMADELKTLSETEGIYGPAG